VREAICQLIDGGEIVSFTNAAGSVGLGRLGVLDLGRRQSTSLGNIDGLAAGMAGATGAGLAAAVATGNIEDVQFAASGGLGGVFDGRIVGDVVSVHDVVVPVTTAELQDRGLEAEFTGPCS